MKTSREKQYATLEELYINNYKLVYLFFSEYIEDKEQIEDLCQTLWTKVMKNPDKYLAMDAYWLANYLRNMARNMAMDFLKKSQKECNVDEELEYRYTEEMDSMLFEEAEFFKEEVRYLNEALKLLTTEERQLIQLKFYDKKSAKVIGEFFGIPEGTVRVRQLRILKKLKEEITRLMKEDGHHEK